MKLQKIGLTVLFAILAILSIGDWRLILHSQVKTSRGAALAQTPADRKAEAYRLFQQGLQQFKDNQFEAALQSWQQALAIYREIKDRLGEGYVLALVGAAYIDLQDLPRAIEYLQQSLALAQSINDQELETLAQGLLSKAQSQSTPRKAEANRLIQQGLQQVQTSQFEAALESWQQALTIYREIKDREGERRALNNLGGVYGSLRDYGKAIEYAQQSLALAREIKDRQGEGNALGNLGAAYLSLGDYGKAIEYLQQSLALAREIQDRSGERRALDLLGSAYFSLGDYSKAIEYSQQHLAFAREIQDRQGEGNALGNLGAAYLSLGDYGKAIEYSQQLLALAREIKDRQGEGRALGLLGSAYNSLGDYGKAIEYSQQHLALAREIQDRQGERAAVVILGPAYLSLRDYSKAIEYLQQSLALAREIQDRQVERLVLGLLGAAYFGLSDYSEAIEYAQQHLALARAIKDRDGEGIALSLLGAAYRDLGDYGKAIEYAQQHLALARAIKDRKDEGNALGNLGATYRRLGDYSKAIEYAQQSLALAREIQDRKDEGQALLILGAAYDSLGDYGKAIEYAQQSLVIAQEIQDREGEGKALGNLGSAYFSLGDYGKAIDYSQQHLALARAIKDRQGEINALGNLGLAYNSLGDYGKAIEYHQQSLALAREIEDRQGQGIAINNQGLTLFKQGNLTAAETTLIQAIEVLESLRGGLKDSEKVSIIDTQSSPYRTLQQVLIAQNKTDTALEISERGRARAFVELLAQRLSPNSQQPLPATFLQPTISQLKQIASTQNSTLVQYSRITDEFKFQGKERTKESDLYIWVIKPTGEVTFRKADLKPLWQQQNTSLAELVSTSRESIGVEGLRAATVGIVPRRPGQKPPDSNQQLQQLHQILIEPIADLLPTDPNAKVTFIPQSFLFLVPFPALKDKAGKYLIEKHTILTAPSIQVLELTHQQRAKSGKGGVLVVGNPTMPSVRPAFDQPPEQLAPLPGAEREAQAIAPLFNTQPLIGNAATKAAILQQLPQAKIVHFATHGIFDDIRGLGSSIALAPSGNDDGLLTAEEILDLKLSAELVVLSACNTGRGRISGDGVVGLSRSLISAGVPSVIVSLWSVPDSPTEFLMREFYQNLQKNPNKAQALRQAMLTTMKQHPDPKDWAAFTLIGEAE